MIEHMYPRRSNPNPNLLRSNQRTPPMLDAWNPPRFHKASLRSNEAGGSISLTIVVRRGGTGSGQEY